MKKLMVVVGVIVLAAVSQVSASSAVDSYIGAIASLAGPASAIPTPPKGYGAVRDEATGDFLLLVPREYCGNDSGHKVSLGRTMYGGRINGYCLDQFYVNQ